MCTIPSIASSFVVLRYKNIHANRQPRRVRLRFLSRADKRKPVKHLMQTANVTRVANSPAAATVAAAAAAALTESVAVARVP